jgi:hypothetical protein
MGKRNKKRDDYWRDTSLIDFDGEKWMDCYGFDGIYSISNYGRVKSEERYDNRGRKIRQRILKQYSKDNHACPTVVFCVDNVHYTKYIATLVGIAFHGWKDDGEVFCHLNKIQTDNRVNNIARLSMSISQQISWERGCLVDWGIGTYQKNETEKLLKEINVYEGNILVRRVCVSCNRELPIKNFYERKDGTQNKFRNECNECCLKNGGVKDIGKLKNRIELAATGLRYCTICKELKQLDTDFSNSKIGYLGKSNTCKKCSYELHSKFITNERNTLGRFYLKQYAIRHNIPIPVNDNDYDIIRNIILEDRKPILFIDGKEFLTIRDFANYIKDYYNNPITMTEKRIYMGKTEEECKLSEHDLRSQSYTKGKIKITDIITKEEYLFSNTRDPQLIKIFGGVDIAKKLKRGQVTRITKLSKYKNPYKIERILN